MAPPNISELLETVEHEDVYRFLGTERDASLEELQAAAERKYRSLHDQEAEDDRARAGLALAGLCLSDLFRDARSRTRYDDALSARSGADDRGGAPGDPLGPAGSPHRATARTAGGSVGRRAEPSGDDGRAGPVGRWALVGAAFVTGVFGLVALAVQVAPALWGPDEGAVEGAAEPGMEATSPVASGEPEAGAEPRGAGAPSRGAGRAGDARIPDPSNRRPVRPADVSVPAPSGPGSVQAGDVGVQTPAGADGAASVEAALGLDRSARRRIQAGLSAAGFAPGPADGVFGAGTRDAIGRWQAARGGAATGYLNAIEAGELSAPGAGGPGAAPAAAGSAGAAPRRAVAGEAPAPAAAGSAGAAPRRTADGEAPAPAAAGRVGTAPRRTAGASAQAPTQARRAGVERGGGTLTIRAAPASRIELDGADVGTTGATGILVVSDIQPGRHIVVARREGYAEASSVVEVAEGRAEVVELASAALPGRLTATANVAGALLRIGDAGEHPLPLSGLEVPAGSHRVTASLDGFRTVANDVEIRPGALTTLDLVLEPVPLDELLGTAAGQLAAGDYQAAAEGARAVVSMRPDAGEAHRLLGMALYELGRFDESVRPLSEAIRLGQEIVLSTSHRHGGIGLRESFCSGTIALSRNAIAFRSVDEPEHDFSVAPAGMTGVRVTQSVGGNAFRVNSSVGDDERGTRRRNFDFVHRNAARTSRERNSPFLVLTCRSCDGSLNVQAALMSYASQLAQ